MELLTQLKPARPTPPPAPPGATEHFAPANFGQAAVSIIFELSSAPQILMIERSHHPKDPWSGQMAFPGGKREPQDPDLLTTCRRETAEEIGLDLLRHGTPCGALSELQGRHGGRLQPFTITPFVFALTSPRSAARSRRGQRAALDPPHTPL